MSVALRHVGAVAALITTGLLLAGCSGSSGSASDTSSAAPSSSASERIATTTDSKFGPTLLQTADLPSGWTAAPQAAGADAVADADDAKLAAGFATCLGLSTRSATPSGQRADVDSPEFTSGAYTVSSTSEPASATSRALLRALVASPKGDTCVGTVLRRVLATSPAIAPATLDGVTADVSPRASGQSASVLGTVHADLTLATGGAKFHVLLDQTFLTGDGVDASVTAKGVNEAVPTATRNAAVAAVARHLAAS